MIERRNPPGRPTPDGAEGVERVNLTLTEDQRRKLQIMAGGPGKASAWVRQAIDKAWKERK